MPNIKPISDLRNYSEVLHDVAAGAPVFLTKNGRGKYAIVDIQDYEKSQATLRLMNELAKGRKSGEALARLVAGENVRVVPMYTDDYGRIVGLVENGDETEVNREMVKNGWAWVYTHFCKADFCREWKIYERQARERKKGLWRGKNPQPPWEWRRYDRR